MDWLVTSHVSIRCKGYGIITVYSMVNESNYAAQIASLRIRILKRFELGATHWPKFAMSMAFYLLLTKRYRS